MDTKISLFFAAEAELYRVEFSHPLLKEKRIAKRGKGFDSAITEFSFQWTGAVRALAWLLVTDAAADIDGAECRPLLSGDKGSPAASLDYAISKQPRWVEDIFGADARGRSLIRRITTRSNPERKRSGPVTIQISSKSSLRIEVFLEGVRLEKSERLEQLAKAVLDIRSSRVDLAGLGESPVRKDIVSLEYLERIYFEELTRMLSSVQVFNRSGLKNECKKINDRPSVKKRAKSDLVFSSSIDTGLSGSARLGLGVSEAQLLSAVNREEPLYCIVSLITTSSLILFEYLRQEKGYNLAIEYEWAYTDEVRKAWLKGSFKKEPDIIVHGIGPVVTMQTDNQRYSYQPLMLLPNISHAIVTPKSATSDLTNGRYLLLSDDVTTPLFCFEELVQHGYIRKNQVALENIEPDESLGFLQQNDPDLRMLMFFPHYRLLSEFGGGKSFELPKEVHQKEVVLMAHEGLIADKERAIALDIAIRNAWLELKADRVARANIVRRVVRDPRYLNTLIRFSGLHNHPNLEFEAA